MAPKPERKSDTEIQRAHDILHFLGTPEAPPVFDSTGVVAIHASHDALAWILGYPCGGAFQANLDYAMELLRALGFNEVDVGQPVSEEEARRRGLAP